jgi:uncharacterized protein
MVLPEKNRLDPQSTRRVAIVGAGISGLSAAYYASTKTRWDVTVFEASPRLGGHAHSHAMNDSLGHAFVVDTGFIVFNDRNYPNFRAILHELNVAPHPTEMSFSVSLPVAGQRGGFEYNGGSLGGLFAQRRNIVSYKYWKLLKEILRFNRLAKVSRTDNQGLEQTMGDWLDHHGFDTWMVTRYLLPLAGAVWSMSPERVRDFPIQSLFHFLDNHGLLDLSHRPQWFSLHGGSETYVKALALATAANFHTDLPVSRVTPGDGGVEIECVDGSSERFDAVIMACHADEALALIYQPDSLEASVLGAFEYSENQIVLHSDPSWMPVRRSAWASWNYVGSGDGENSPIAVSYWMNGLQRLNTDELMVVTLNPESLPRDVHRQVNYRHPQFDLKAFSAQQRREEIQGHRNLWYAGAHWRWGFHEDGVVAAIWALRDMGVCVPLLGEMEG